MSAVHLPATGQHLNPRLAIQCLSAVVRHQPVDVSRDKQHLMCVAKPWHMRVKLNKTSNVANFFFTEFCCLSLHRV